MSEVPHRASSGADISRLLRSLAHGDWRVRAGACEALAGLPALGRRAAPRLLELLRDPEPAVRDAAFWALHQMQPLEPVLLERVAQALESFAPEVRERANRLLSTATPRDASVWTGSRSAPGS